MPAISRALGALGWHPVVITPREGFFHHADTKPPVGVEVIRTPSLELSRGLRRLYSRVKGVPRPERDGGAIAPLQTGAVGDSLRQLVRDVVYLPDAQVGWMPFVIRAATRRLRVEHGRRVIFSSSVPFSAHLAAMQVSAQLDISWVAEFRDAWTTLEDSVYTRSPWRKRVDARIEGSILRRCSAVVVTTECTRQSVLTAFPDLDPSKIHVVLSGFDPFPVGSPPAPDASMSLLYSGTLYPGDDMEPLMMALDAIERKQPGSIRLRIAGPPAQWRPYLDSSPERGRWMDLLGMLPQREAEAETARSSVLLLHRPDPALAKQHIAGKLFTYLGARRPILAIVPPGTEMEDLLRRHGNAYFVHSYTPEAVTPALDALLGEHRAGRLGEPRVSEEAIRPMYAQEQARRLSGILDSVARKRQ